MSFLTKLEIEALDCDISLNRNAPYLIGGVSRTQLSIARHYGGCTFKHQSYTYMPLTDEIIRDDVLRWVTKFRKENKDGQGSLI